MRSRTLANVVSGAGAGLAGTLTMSAVVALARAAGLLGEPPPRKLTRRMLSLLAPSLVRSERRTNVTATAGHLGYGAAVGALYGLGVWAVSYAGWIPKLGLMPPPKRDRPGRQGAMVLAHLVYGATLGSMERWLAARTAARSTR